MNKCKDHKILIPGLIEDDLDAECKADLLAHLCGCATCREEKARIEGMITLLDEINPPVQQFPGPVMTEGDGPPGEADDGSNGKPKPGD